MKRAISGGRRTRKTPNYSHLTRALALALVLGGSQPALAQSSGAVGNADSWVDDEFQADWGLAAINAQYAYARGLTGNGVRVGLFDSGVDLKHGEFAGKDANGIRVGDLLADGSVCGNETLMTDDACYASTGDTVAIDYVDYDQDMIQYLVNIGYVSPGLRDYIEQEYAGAHYATHGTHVAGTMVANRDGSGSQGVAFGAALTSARMFGNSYMDTAGLIQSLGGDVRNVGIDEDGIWLGTSPDSTSFESMYQQMAAQGVRAINHSWGLTVEPTTAAEMDAIYANPENAAYLATFTDPSLKNGVLQVWAAGNNYGAIAGIYATLPRYVPEAEKYWLSVANLNPDGTLDESSSICGLSMDWCVTAPGTDITSSVVAGQIDASPILDADGNVIGLQVDAATPEYGYGDLTGTSMAAPHVTGALALLMERFPYLDNPQIRDILLTTATDLGAAGVDEIYGWGLINLRKAIDGPGQLRVDTDVVMNQRAGGTQVWEGEAWDDWSNDIGGHGKLTKSGIGWLRLSGDNSFAGASVKEGILELTGDNTLAGDVSVDGNAILKLEGSLRGSAVAVNRGYAVINGTISGGTTTVAAAGTLSGSGTLGDTIVRGTIAPGNSVGTLTIAGDYTQEAGSVYAAELGTSSADLIAASGVANLLGGTLKLSVAEGTSVLGHSYRLLTAGGGINGAFDSVDSSAISSFVRADIFYRAGVIGLEMLRGATFASVANSANQTAVGTAVDSLGDDSTLLQRMVTLSDDQARSALDNLGGELHASTKALLMQDARMVRDSALTRARAGHDAFSAQRDNDADIGAWAEVQHGSSRLDSDGNAAEARLSGNTTLVGADLQLDGGWRLGVLGGGGRSDINVRERGSKARVDATHAGLYVGQQWNGFGVRAGYAQAWQDVDTDRRVVIGSLQENAHARYDATTRQAFVEAGYRLAFGNTELEPFAQFAQVRVKTDGATEQGGVSALTVAGDTQKANLSTAGVRLNANLASDGQAQSWLSLRGSLAYRRASGDVASTATATLAGSEAFTVAGAPLARNATLAEVGLSARLSPNTLVELGYNGLFSSDAHDTGVNARVSVQF